MDIRRGAVVLNQTADGEIKVAYAGPDIHEAKRVYRASTGPGVWTFHESHHGQTKRYQEQPKRPARPAVVEAPKSFRR